jgi:hypothetical protein
MAQRLAPAPAASSPACCCGSSNTAGSARPTCAKASPSAPGSSACPADARDSRDLAAAVAEGDADAALALAVFAHRARRELAAATSLPTLDALVFTGGIG